jgi:hypothetical protein
MAVYYWSSENKKPLSALSGKQRICRTLQRLRAPDPDRQQQ